MLIGDVLSEQGYLFQMLAHVAEHVKENDTASSLQYASWFLIDLQSCTSAGLWRDDPWYMLFKEIISASYGYVAKRNLAAIDGRRYMGQVIDAALRASKMFDELGEVYHG
jgi:hypothetical protein